MHEASFLPQNLNMFRSGGGGKRLGQNARVSQPAIKLEQNLVRTESSWPSRSWPAATGRGSACAPGNPGWPREAGYWYPKLHSIGSIDFRFQIPGLAHDIASAEGWPIHAFELSWGFAFKEPVHCVEDQVD
jgi:hypothetical protein